MLLSRLMDGVLIAISDGDKVRSSGVHGMGALLSILDASSGVNGGGSGSLLMPSAAAVSLWLEQALPSLQSCLTGNMIVQWEAATTTQGLLSNERLRMTAAVADMVVDWQP